MRRHVVTSSPLMTSQRFGHMTLIRPSDWSIPKILRSDWLRPKPPPITTHVIHTCLISIRTGNTRLCSQRITVKKNGTLISDLNLKTRSIKITNYPCLKLWTHLLQQNGQQSWGYTRQYPGCKKKKNHALCTVAWASLLVQKFSKSFARIKVEPNIDMTAFKSPVKVVYCSI